MNKKILIVGGVAGGASAAARLRRLDENAQIIMFEKGEYISFANCGLPYYIGEEITDKSSLTLQTPESFNARFNVDVRINSEVLSVDKKSKLVTVKNIKTGEIYSENYDKLILSPGAEPIKPPIDGIDSKRVFTLRNIPDTYRIKDFIDNNNPKSVVIVGGGYIGVEMAENLKSLGMDVTIVELSNQVIAPIDYDMACDVHKYLKQNAVNLLLSNAMQSIAEDENQLKVKLSSGEVLTDILIMSVGVRPESKIAKDAGLLCNERGGIIVNEHMQTSDEDIYAVGDVVEVTDFITATKAMIPLAGPANKQGRICADNICGLNTVYEGTQGSSILKVFDMTIATTGINEKTAKKNGLNYDKVFLYSPSHAGYYPGAVNMSIKVLFDTDNGKILGAQLIGYEGTDKRCDIIATAIRFGATYKDLTKLELCYVPPYSSAKDPINMAGFVIENIMTGKIKNFHWDSIEELQKRKDVNLIDVRTPQEYENGNIHGFINIPLDELRGKINTIDKSKPVYVHCQTGLRSYIACRILSQNGFECYNLSGGYRLYNSIFSTQENNSEIKSNKNISATKENQQNKDSKLIKINACGLQCPGPIVKLGNTIKEVNDGDTIEISTTDPAFASDIQGFCRRTGNNFIGMTSQKGVSVAKIQKCRTSQELLKTNDANGKNFIVFSGDLDKAIASFIMANAAAAMGRKVSMFFTFWGLAIQKGNLTGKGFFGLMLGLMNRGGINTIGPSRFNFGGIGRWMFKKMMRDKKVASLPELLAMAQELGVRMIACNMSMEVMEIAPSDLIDGVEMGGVATFMK